MERITASIEEASSALSLGKTKIYELLRANELEAIKVGRRTLITIESMRDFVQRQRQVR